MDANLHRAVASIGVVPLVAALFLITAFHPASYAQDTEPDPCEMLSDDSLGVRLGSGLERKLMFLCGEMDQRVLERGQSLSELGPGLFEQALLGNVVAVSDPTTDTSPNTTQSETSIVIGEDDNMLCAAWNDSGAFFAGGGFSGFGSSTDGGSTWTDGGSFPAGSVPPSIPVDINFGDPSLAFSERDETFYYAALSVAGLSLWKSTDGCQTFSYVGPIHIGFGFGDDKELMAVDNNEDSPFYGRIYVGWTNFGLFFVPPFDLNQTTYSDDGGVTWSTPATLPGSGTAGQGMWPAVAPNGDVYFALLNRSFVSGGLQDQWIYRSIDGGASWTQMTDIGTAQLRPEEFTSSFLCGRQALNGFIRNLSSPQIAIHPDEDAPAGYVIHAVYPYDSDGIGGLDESNVFYRRSTDGALTWSAEIMLNDDATTTDQWFPALGVAEEDDDAVVVVSWYDRRLDPVSNLAFDRYMVASQDGGLTWEQNVRVSDVTSPVATILPNFDFIVRSCYHGDYDQVVVDHEGEHAHIIWSGDQRIAATGPDPDIYYENVEVDDDDDDEDEDDDD